MKNILNENSIVGLALKPQNINTTLILGEAIEAPWQKGRFITFDVIGAAMTGSDAITLKFEGRLKSTYNHGSTTTPEPYVWENIQDKDGNDLQFDAQHDADDLENGHITGTIDLNRLSTVSDDGTDEYDQIRITAKNGVAQNVIVGAVYRITELYSVPAMDLNDDGLFGKMCDLLE